MGRVAGATTAVLTEASSLLLDEISGCPVGLTNAQSNVPRTPGPGRGPGDGERPHRRERKGRAGEFRQRLDVLLATDGSARAVARQLYERFEGDLSRLPALLQLLEDRWEFPTRVFSLLWVHIRRASGRSEDHDKNVSEDEWVCDPSGMSDVNKLLPHRTQPCQHFLQPLLALSPDLAALDPTADPAMAAREEETPKKKLDITTLQGVLMYRYSNRRRVVLPVRILRAILTTFSSTVMLTAAMADIVSGVQLSAAISKMGAAVGAAIVATPFLESCFCKP
eukprot:s335_g4.t1